MKYSWVLFLEPIEPEVNCYTKLSETISHKPRFYKLASWNNPNKSVQLYIHFCFHCVRIPSCQWAIADDHQANQVIFTHLVLSGDIFFLPSLCHCCCLLLVLNNYWVLCLKCFMPWHLVNAEAEKHFIRACTKWPISDWCGMSQAAMTSRRHFALNKTKTKTKKSNSSSRSPDFFLFMSNHFLFISLNSHLIHFFL